MVTNKIKIEQFLYEKLAGEREKSLAFVVVSGSEK